MNSLQYAVNGVPLDQRNCVVAQGTSFLPGLSMRRTVTSIPGAHGSVPCHLPPVAEERQITLKIGVGGEEFLSQTRRLLAIFAQPSLTLSRTVGDQTQSAVVELASLETDENAFGRIAIYTVTLAMPIPFWRSETARMMDLAAGTSTILPATSFMRGKQKYWTEACEDGTSALYGVDMTDGCLSDAPITGMIIRVPAKVTGLAVTDATSFTGVSWSGNVQSGYLYVDTGTLTAWQSTSPNAWDGSTQTLVAGVDYPAAGMLQIWPTIDGSYALNLAFTGGATNATVRFFQSWW